MQIGLYAQRVPSVDVDVFVRRCEIQFSRFSTAFRLNNFAAAPRNAHGWNGRETRDRTVKKRGRQRAATLSLIFTLARADVRRRTTKAPTRRRSYLSACV